jgi:glutamyl-tRNA synthetase
MRMEDLDPDRSKQIYADAAIEDLRWLGIRWQEGPDRDGNDHGPFAPYAQSQRRTLYLTAWRTLLQRGHLYPCRCSRKDLETALSAPHESARPEVQALAIFRSPSRDSTGTRTVTQPALQADTLDLDDEPIYPGTCRNGDGRQQPGPAFETPDGSNWRFRVPDGEVVEFEDGNLGRVRFVAGVDFGDFVVWRRDGVPSYQLACVADDHAMEITEVVRGADLLKSTARQILLNRALGYKDPAWFHTKLVVDHNGRRLAKRHGALSLRTLRQRGLTPMNILAAELPEEI